MARRLVTLMLALVVTAAPVAAQICEAVCAHTSQASHSESAPHQHHSVTASAPAHHHDRSATPLPFAPTNHALSTQLRPCVQVAAVAAESRQNVWDSVAPLVLPILYGEAPNVDGIQAPHIDSRHGPPVPVRSIAPLRI